MPLSWNLGTLTSWNPLGHSRPVTGLIYLYLYLYIYKFIAHVLPPPLISACVSGWKQRIVNNCTASWIDFQISFWNSWMENSWVLINRGSRDRLLSETKCWMTGACVISCPNHKSKAQRREEKPTRCHWMVYFTYNITQHVSGTCMPIIRSSRLYMCYYRLWCAMPWLLVVGGQVQGSRLCVRDEGCCSSSWYYQNGRDEVLNDRRLRHFLP